MSFGIAVPAAQGLVDLKDVRTLKQSSLVLLEVPNGYSDIATTGTPGWAPYNGSSYQKEYEVTVPSGKTMDEVVFRWRCFGGASSDLVTPMVSVRDATTVAIILQSDDGIYYPEINLQFMEF